MDRPNGEASPQRQADPSRFARLLSQGGGVDTLPPVRRGEIPFDLALRSPDPVRGPRPEPSRLSLADVTPLIAAVLVSVAVLSATVSILHRFDRIEARLSALEFNTFAAEIR